MSAGYAAQSGGFGYAASAAKTILNLVSVANNIARLCEFSCSNDGVLPTAIPCTVDLCKSTQATAGTSTSTPAITQIRGETRPALCVPLAKYTAEPTVLTPIKTWYIPEFAGALTMQYPLGREPALVGVGGYAILVTMSSTVATTNVRAHVEWEEG